MRPLTSLACALSCAALLHAQQASMDAATCERLAASLNLPNANVTLAQSVTARPIPPARRAWRERPACCPRGSAAVLSRHLDADAVIRLGHQVRGLAAACGMERQVSAGRQWRLGRIDSIRGARLCAASRIRRLVYRYGTRR